MNTHMATILLVDDSSFMRDRCAKLLSKEGHTIVHATNGKEGLEKYSQSKPDLVFMDITMPEMDGITAVEEIKKIDINAKIIMLSAVGQKEMVMKAIQKGAKYFIVKPFEPGKVLEVLSKFLPK